MKLSFWAKFGVLMLALVAGQCLAWIIEYRAVLGIGNAPADGSVAQAAPASRSE
jgi:hypothetical protein